MDSKAKEIFLPGVLVRTLVGRFSTWERGTRVIVLHEWDDRTLHIRKDPATGVALANEMAGVPKAAVQMGSFKPDARVNL